MPALQPPSMQIGGLPQGASPLPPVGPPLAEGANVAPPAIVQQVSGNSTTAAPANFTLTISATKAGTFLIACIATAQSGAASIPTPAGYTFIAAGGNGGNTLGGRIFYMANNPGGLTSFAITGMTGVNGIACAFYELSNVFATDYGYGGGQGNQNFSNGATGVSVSAYGSPPTGPTVMVGFEADVTGQAYTPGNTGNWVAGTAATSTNGATNAIIRPFFTVTSPVPLGNYQLAGTLAGAIANGICLASFICGTSQSLTQPAPQTWPGSAAVIGGWGALGPTKPGGAGGGQ